MNRTARALLAGIACVTLIVDQATKALAVAALEGQPRTALLGELVGLRFLRNPGAAFGMGAGSTWVFGLVAIAVFIGILFAAKNLGSRMWAVGLGLLMGGLLGNLADRLFRPPAFFHGAVVDFIDLHFFVCNAADIAISAAAVVLVLASLQGRTLTGERAAEGEHV